MKKGITPVVAIILLLLITISIVGFAAVFFSRTAETAGEAAEEEQRQFLRQSLEKFKIEGVNKNRVTIRNSGANELTNLAFLVNGVKVDHSGPAALAAGAVDTYFLDDAQLALVPEPATLKVSGLGHSEEINANFYGKYTIGYWRLDEGQGNVVIDSSGNENTGTVMDNEGDQWTTGKYGSALVFDGIDDYVAIDNLFYDTAGQINEISACAWFRTTFSGTSWSENWAFIDFDRSEYFNLYINGEDGTIGFSTRGTTTSTNDFYSINSYNDGEWHHACGVYDGTDKILYIDGAEDNRSVNAHNGEALGTGIIRYGMMGDGSEADMFDGSRNNIYYEGEIDEVRILSVARSMDTT